MFKAGTSISDTTPAPRERCFFREGVSWRVRLHVGGYDRRRPDLVFESESVVRRVRDYPEDWYQLPEEALYALSWKR
jgi:hypothetical protein